MSDIPNEALIELLAAADADDPATAIVLEDDGPQISVRTGHTDNPVESQLTMIAGYMTWLADRTDVDVERVAQDALEIAADMKEEDAVFVDPDLIEGMD